VTYRVVWLPDAMSALRRLHTAEPDGAQQITAAVGGLATEPHPDGSRSLGSSGFHRLRLGRYRLLYEIDSDAATVYVVNVGSVPGRPW
jgi:mRNA-degrading endonuclease RelE of RelBE toxin-antitoxin system